MKTDQVLNDLTVILTDLIHVWTKSFTSLMLALTFLIIFLMFNVYPLLWILWYLKYKCYEFNTFTLCPLKHTVLSITQLHSNSTWWNNLEECTWLADNLATYSNLYLNFYINIHTQPLLRWTSLTFRLHITSGIVTSSSHNVLILKK